ncbi:hypothetical protein [Moraxella cuniculi]|uniref:hypothetical protein n=1 Tax=Moraxella cuniculi TaxID=34061 RepID=UPI0014754033|nr:hypothetical protein [Moraxella cuniculi]
MSTDKPAISQSIHQASPDRLLNHSKKTNPITNSSNLPCYHFTDCTEILNYEK